MKHRKGTRPVFVYLPETDWARLRAEADRRGHPMTHMVENLVREWLDALDADEAQRARRP